MHCLETGDLPALQGLLASGALSPHRPLGPPFAGMRLLHGASGTGHLHLVEWLVEKQGIDPNEGDVEVRAGQFFRGCMYKVASC